MASLKGKKVLVMGLGLHGGALGTIEWLISQGAEVTATDMKTAEQLAPTLKKLEKYPTIRYVLGRHDEADFIGSDMVIRNPSVPKNSKFLQLARKHSIPVEMDSSLFFEYSPTQDIVGVTGSKGKTTTANAIATMLDYLVNEKRVDLSTVAVGIDGVSPLGRLANIRKDGPVVFELSSWRLEALIEKGISPQIAVVTSIYKDHLNTYSSFQEYIETKKGIFKFQGADSITILNADDAEIKTWEKEVPGKLYWYAMREVESGQGIFIRHGLVIIRDEAGEHELLHMEDLPLAYEHEQRNLLPAMLIGYLKGMPVEDVVVAIKLVVGLPHRLEVVAEIDGVTYINDSAATMPDATIAALKSLADKSIVHILGGSDKALEFEELAAVEGKANIRALVWLPGTATQRMKQLVLSQVSDVPVFDADSMESAVELAKQAAKPGDVILMSPGATSFGLFLHEFDRGDKFRAAVKKLLP
ncbi:MAG: UDP-N-acetylmuramoyl-L-alanine--D-glutamate ligase [Candidatus Andersenbacteria bacterium]|nr:UDP-N-acetylmuramoyl-L-alanine--D-glutamate ligase [Candidatus Andersenbacteria bacterium]